MNKKESKSIVAIEFVGTLQEEAHDVLVKCLKKLNVPEEVITLAEHVNSLSYYLENVNDPRMDFSPNGFDIQAIIIEAVNNIAALGGRFSSSAVGISMPRKGTMLDEKEA